MKTKLTKEQKIELFREAIKDWKCDDRKDKELCKAYTQDRKALREVLGVYKGGDLVECYNMIRKLDTIVREVVPYDIYVEVTKAAFAEV